MYGKIFQPEIFEAPKPRWGAGQLGEEVTRPQIVYDVLAGVIAPLLCFYFDPMVFRSSGIGFSGHVLVPEYQVAVYAFSAVQMVVLCLWLLSGGVFRSGNSVMAGVMICGAIFSGVVGLLLFPFSVFGLIYGIGVFGFTPFFTALVYLRNGQRAWRAGSGTPALFRTASLFLGVLLALTIPSILSAQLHTFVENSVEAIIKGDSRTAIAVARRLKPISYIASSEMDRLVLAYLSEPDDARRELLKTCYHEITGESIEERAQILAD
jgi:hypothetical protein